jgi:hypothetical protein
LPLNFSTVHQEICTNSKYKQFLQSTKKQVQTDKTLIDTINNQLTDLKFNLNELEYEVDDTQQYLRRDCIEITGIPKLENEDPTKLIKELCNNMSVTLKDDDISIVHRLPDTKKVKNRLIAKFVRREKKDEIYNEKKKCQGKSVNTLPSVNSTGQSFTDKIYINESLSSRRKKLFSKIYQFKKENSYKYVWTKNGKIYLKENDSSPSYNFVTLGQFERFCNYDNTAYN